MFGPSFFSICYPFLFFFSFPFLFFFVSSPFLSFSFAIQCSLLFFRAIGYGLVLFTSLVPLAPFFFSLGWYVCDGGKA